jgi:hypothetical protein
LPRKKYEVIEISGKERRSLTGLFSERTVIIMTIFEFEKLLKKRRAGTQWINYLTTITFIGLAIYMIFGSLLRKPADPNLNLLVLSGCLMVIGGIYILKVIINACRASVLINSAARKQNEQLIKQVYSMYMGKRYEADTDHIEFIYKRGWWRLRYTVHLFADDNLIGVKADSTKSGWDGVVDFGASARLEKKILLILEKLAHPPTV